MQETQLKQMIFNSLETIYTFDFFFSFDGLESLYGNIT